MRKHLFALPLIISSFIIHTPTYITNTNVIDVINLKIDPNQTVVVENNKIAIVDKADRIKIPANATVIHGEGKHLIPGFVDAHVQMDYIQDRMLSISENTNPMVRNFYGCIRIWKIFSKDMS